MAFYAGKDVAKLKSKGGGKWKYMSEKDMVGRLFAGGFSELISPPARYFYKVFAIPVSDSPYQSSCRQLLIIVHRSIFMWYMWRIEGADFSPL